MSAVHRADPLVESGPVGYQWEASDDEVARTYGLDPAQVIRFDTNTSPRTPPELPAWIRASAESARLNEYPDATYARLTDAIARRLGVAQDRIVVGAGADEVLDLAARTCLSPGGRAVAASPTYAMYGVLTRQRGARLEEVPRGSAATGFALDGDALLRAARGADLVWLCDPNNPTGTVERTAELLRLLRAMASAPGGGPVLVVDEAYREFAGASVVEEIERIPGLVVVRTLSKAYGLAGIRVGYAVAGRALAARLAAIRPPGSIATISAALGAAALGAPEHALANVAAIAAERERLRGRLADLGWRVPPSVTNFVLLDAGSPGGAAEAAERLLRHGLVPRQFDSGALRGFLRITVRTADQDDRLLAAIGRGPGREEP